MSAIGSYSVRTENGESREWLLYNLFLTIARSHLQPLANHGQGRPFKRGIPSDQIIVQVNFKEECPFMRLEF